VKTAGSTFDQSEFDVRCEWGEPGVAALAPLSDVVIIVDVLSFSTSVEIAVNRGAVVYPYPWRDERAEVFAASTGAVLADPVRARGAYSLSPESLLSIGPGARLVLPSPNGAALTLAAGPAPVLAGCLRNARAVAAEAVRYGRKIAVIAAGERWPAGSGLRPCVEDQVGAGAIISHLPGSLSPEALSAAAVYRDAQPRLGEVLGRCSSGKELIEGGFAGDVALAAQLNVSACVPVLKGQRYIRAEGSEDR
jgi:2-phosphosulfolactate phosphatase